MYGNLRNKSPNSLTWADSDCMTYRAVRIWKIKPESNLNWTVLLFFEYESNRIEYHSNISKYFRIWIESNMNKNWIEYESNRIWIRIELNMNRVEYWNASRSNIFQLGDTQAMKKKNKIYTMVYNVVFNVHDKNIDTNFHIL